MFSSIQKRKNTCKNTWVVIPSLFFSIKIWKRVLLYHWSVWRMFFLIFYPLGAREFQKSRFIPNTTICNWAGDIFRNILKLSIEWNKFFFYQFFLSQTLTIHRTEGEGRGPSFIPLYHFLLLTNMETFICKFASEMTITYF